MFDGYDNRESIEVFDDSEIWMVKRAIDDVYRVEAVNEGCQIHV